MHLPRYCLFFDNHTMPHCPDVGAAFDVEAFTDQVAACGVDFLTFHARCNQGMAYYNTEIGTRHPSLNFDLFGKLAQACQRKGIALSAYFNGGISSEEGIRHREWTTLAFDGREYREPRLTPFVRTMCYNTPYRDHLIAMILEVARTYPVAGFFVDCLGPYPCICPICVREMKAQGLDWQRLDVVQDFAARSAKRLAQEIARTLTAINPEYLLYFNGVACEEQLDFATYLECECLPTGGWGYDYLPIHAHYLRTLTDRPIVNMTGRFYTWGDFGGLRPEEALRFELLYGLANGMRPNIGDHFHPRGDLSLPVFEQTRRIYSSLQRLEPWFEGAENLSEIGVVYQGKQAMIASHEPLRGVTRMLGELKAQFDIVTEGAQWKPYRLLILPDDIVIHDGLKARLQAHLKAGGTILSSGASGLDVEKTAFVLQDAWGLEYEGECDWNPAYFLMCEPLPPMPLSLYSTGIYSKALPGTEVAAHLVEPYSSRSWDGEYAFFYNPPDKTTGFPALSYHRQVAHFSHRIFSGYHTRPSVDLRRMFACALRRLLPQPLLETDGLPSFSRAFVTRQPGRLIVHLFAYLPELRGENTQMIEEPIPVSQASISLRLDGADIAQVYRADDRAPVDFEQTDNRVQVTLPPFSGYTMTVFETKPLQPSE